MEYFMILLGTVLVNNVVLVKFLGLCPFMGVSKQIDSAIGMGMATTFVLTLASVAGWMLEHWVLQPFDLGFLRILSFILVIAATVQFTEMVIKKVSPALYQVLGIFLPLITTNCAVLGVTILNIESEYNFVESLVCAVGAGAGFMLAMVLFSGVRKRLEDAKTPKCFEGLPITLVAASITSLSFMGFGGVIENIFKA